MNGKKLMKETSNMEWRNFLKKLGTELEETKEELMEQLGREWDGICGRNCKEKENAHSHFLT